MVMVAAYLYSSGPSLPSTTGVVTARGMVIAGSGRVKLDDEIHEIARLDAIRVGPEVKRAFEAGPDGIEFLAFGQHFEKDGRILPDWWID